MEKIKGTMQEQLKLEHEAKDFAEKVLRATYEQAALNSTAGETKIGSKLMEHVFSDCYTNVKNVLFPQKKRGVVPKYQGVVNQLKSLYEGDEDTLIKMSVTSILNVLIGFVMHNSDDTFVVFDTAMDKLVVNYKEEIISYQYLKQATRQDAAFFEDGLKHRLRNDFKVQYARRAYKDMGFTPDTMDTDNLYKLVTVLLEAVIKGSGYFEYKVEANHTDGNKRPKKYLKAADWLVKAWAKSIDVMALNSFKFSPCVIPPKPWEGIKDGAYYGVNAPFAQFIRVNMYQHNAFLDQYIQKCEQLDLTWLFKCVNALQSTPFIINQRVLDTMVSIMDNHGGLGGLPRTDETPKIPHLIDPTPEELEAHKKRLVAYYKHERARVSKVLRTNTSLGCAKKYSKYEKIYFPWNLDYRGRIYPMCPALNPQGDDTQKALLLFADPTPLSSEESLKWFYIAGAGFAGLDKIPFDERIKWVLSNEDNILQSAASPLTYTWWDEVAGDESPMEFLAFCFEFERLRVYQADHDGSAVGFRSGLPISFDGTCSGLQHFSMLLADEIGGKNVNLIPDETVHDIYQVVADKVNVVLHQDVITGTADDYKKDKKVANMYLTARAKSALCTVQKSWQQNGCLMHNKSLVQMVSSAKCASALS